MYEVKCSNLKCILKAEIISCFRAYSAAPLLSTKIDKSHLRATAKQFPKHFICTFGQNQT